MFTIYLANIIQKDLHAAPAVVLYGPRQVGKTTVVKQLAAANSDQFLYPDIQLPSDRVVGSAYVFLKTNFLLSTETSYKLLVFILSNTFLYNRALESSVIFSYPKEPVFG